MPGRVADLRRTAARRAFLEDHAFLLEALVGLYEATGDPRWYGEATALADAMIERFEDPERGGFFTTASDHEQLAARRKDLEDSPIPSGNSAAAFGLLRLGALSGEGRYERHALGVLRLLVPLATRHPLAFGHLLGAADFYLAPVKEVAIVVPRPGPASCCGSSAGPFARTWCSPPARPTACRCSRAAVRSTAAPRRTCASGSCARRRSRAPTTSPPRWVSPAAAGSWELCLPLRRPSNARPAASSTRRSRHSGHGRFECSCARDSSRARSRTGSSAGSRWRSRWAQAPRPPNRTSRAHSR